MRVDPEAPRINLTERPFNNIDGIILLTGRFPPETSFGLPGQGLNSAIWLFIRIPVPGITTPEWLLFE